jgi:hypothetical protein
MERLLDLLQLFDMPEHCGADELRDGSMLRMEPSELIKNISIKPD